MNIASYAVFPFAAAVLFPAELLRAHHSFATHYLTDQSMEITGVVTEATLRNPHSFFTLDVMTEDGVVEWEVEVHAIPLLRRIGIDAGTIRPGDTITVVGPPPRGNRRVTFGGRITLADGRQFALLGGGLQDSLTRYRAESVTVRAGDTVLQRMSGRWGVRIAAGTSVLSDTPLPLNAAGRAARNSYDPRNTPAMNCITPSLPTIYYAPYVFEIRMEDPGLVMFHEYEGLTRPLSLTEAVDSPSAFGRRTARVEGDTLVIESTEFTEHPAGLASDWDPNGRGGDVPGSMEKRLLERFTVGEDGAVLLLDYVLEDPVYLEESYRAQIVWDRLTDDAPIYDFECDVDVATRSTLNAAPL